MIIKHFQEKCLKLICDTAISQTADFLDITFDLKDKTYRHYKKPNDIISYVSCKSHHPLNILERLPNMINNRIEKHCSTK